MAIAAESADHGAYRPIEATLAGTTIVLTGEDLTVDELQQIARRGAKVRLSAAAAQRQADNYGLLLEAQAEGIAVYNLNRGGGLGRMQTTLEGDPLSPANKATLEQRELESFQGGAMDGDGPEVSAEEVVRATMAIRANQMTHEMPSPALSQRLLDLLNSGITPVLQSHGTVGESDWNILPAIAATMVGRGEAYSRGERMPAAEALRRAGLAPLQPFAVDFSTLANSNGYTTALAALAVADGERVLDWADLLHALDLNAMNGSITPLSAPVQRTRPFKWLNWDAARVLDMLRGSYLFDGDPQRILADADSLRASSIRQGSAWQAWAALRDDVRLQMNSADHNPAVLADLSPRDSWELSTAQMMKYYVKGGKYSHGKHGYIVSSANWDPYPLVNDVEAFTNALVNLGVVVAQRSLRFNNEFFTAVRAADVLTGDLRQYAPQANAMVIGHLWQELQILASPVPAEGLSTDSQGNGDIESQAAIKTLRSREATDVLLHLLAQDLLTATFWMNVRLTQDSSRRFGPAPEAALAVFRAVLPGRAPTARRPDRPPAALAYASAHEHPAAEFYTHAARH
ncbi:MAG: aromatic amino acid lyase [Steroidobacteraceae bacterium]